jgi:hypothetical protein
VLDGSHAFICIKEVLFDKESKEISNLWIFSGATGQQVAKIPCPKGWLALVLGDRLISSALDTSLDLGKQVSKATNTLQATELKSGKELWKHKFYETSSSTLQVPVVPPLPVAPPRP